MPKARTLKTRSAPVPGKKTKRGRKKNFVSYKMYIHQILKSTHPELAISVSAVAVLDSFAYDMSSRMAEQSSKLAKYSKRETITSKEIQTSAILVLPGELSKHSIAEGRKAVARYQTSTEVDKNRREANKGKAIAERKKRTAKPESRSARSGLIFPVGRVHRYLKQGRFAPRIGASAPVYLAAIVEYLMAEVLELSGNVAVTRHHQRITPRDIQLAVRNDNELCILMNGVTILDGGVFPSYQMKKQREQAKAREERELLAASKLAAVAPPVVSNFKKGAKNPVPAPTPTKKANPTPVPAPGKRTAPATASATAASNKRGGRK